MKIGVRLRGNNKRRDYMKIKVQTELFKGRSIIWIIPVNGKGQLKAFFPLHPRFETPSQEKEALTNYLNDAYGGNR